MKTLCHNDYYGIASTAVQQPELTVWSDEQIAIKFVLQ